MINLGKEINPARDDAMRHALYRANRESKAMAVYVAPPGSGALPSDKYNTWFVRSVDEPAPDNAQLFHTQAPTLAT